MVEIMRSNKKTSKKGEFTIKRSDLSCSQPYLNQKKCEAIKKMTIEELSFPVFKFQGKYYLTDGHSRAFICDKEELTVYLDRDLRHPTQRKAYETYVKWTLALGVKSIDDLADHIVDEKEFEKLWINRCTEYYADLQANLERLSSKYR